MQRLRMKLSQGDPVSLKPADRTGGSRKISASKAENLVGADGSSDRAIQIGNH